ncbi:hypothetical protein Q9966_008137 [Columba livia]|nr:hypothetical protein Q9966_008137 [Columba livia]
MKGEITVEERRVVDRAQENGNGNSCRNDERIDSKGKVIGNLFEQYDLQGGNEVHLCQRIVELCGMRFKELPEKWKNLKKIAFTVKHEVVPLQSKEVSVIRQKCVFLEIAQLNALINMLLGELTPGDHQNIMTICTIDVHARDVVATFIAQKPQQQGMSSVIDLVCSVTTVESHSEENLPDVLEEQVEPQDWGEEGPSISLTFLTGASHSSLETIRPLHPDGTFLLFEGGVGSTSSNQQMLLKSISTKPTLTTFVVTLGAERDTI